MTEVFADIYLVFPAVVILSYFLGTLYIKLALKWHIHAEPNFRSLHDAVTPRGVGIVVALLCLLFFLSLYDVEFFHHYTGKLLFWGGLFVAINGILDDKYEFRARYRLAVQVIAAVFILSVLQKTPSINIGNGTVFLGPWAYPLLLLLIIWFYNLFNFIDGIDAMALSATIFVLSVMSLYFYLDQEMELSLLLLFLVAANAGVLFLNWPPAKVFIGDAGASFNSFMISAIALFTSLHGQQYVWLWMILFAYYFSDTGTTLISRIILKPRNWYLPHRSHAYQNLARIWESHLKMNGLVWAINLVWVLPMSLMAYFNPHYGWLICVLTYIPLLVFTYRYGPAYEDR